MSKGTFDFEKFVKKLKAKYEGNDSILDIISYLEGSWNQGDKNGLKEYSMKLLDIIEETDDNKHIRNTLLEIQTGSNVPKNRGKKKSGLVKTLRKDVNHGSTEVSPNTSSKDKGRNDNGTPVRHKTESGSTEGSPKLDETPDDLTASQDRNDSKVKECEVLIGNEELQKHYKDKVLERFKSGLIEKNEENVHLNKKLEIYEQDIKYLKAETSKLTVERDQAKISLGSYQEKLQKCEREAENEINELKNETGKLAAERDQYKDSLKSCKADRQKYEQGAKKEIQEMKIQIDELVVERNQYKDRAEALEAELQKKQKKVVKEYKDDISKLKDEKRRLTQENELNVTKISDLKNRVEMTGLKLQRSKTTIDELATRLSAVAGARLLHNNPNVADLSDTNRPTKLAEQYSELYDNEWTDAFTSLDDGGLGTEEEIINVMLEILLDCFTVCMEKANDQLNYIKSALLFPVELKSAMDDYWKLRKKRKNILMEIGDKTFTVEQEKAMTDLRKQTVDKAHKDLTQTILSRHEDVPYSKEVTKYIQSCTELCWKMVVQTPPVYIDVFDRKGERFSQDTFKAYTRTGTYIRFVVWPPLFLHEGGSLLNKGVAQGCDVEGAAKSTDKLHPNRRGGGPKDSEKNDERKRNDEANAENSPKDEESSEDEESRERNGKRANSQNRKQNTIEMGKGEERGGNRNETDGKSCEKKKSPKKKKKKKQQ